MTQIHLRLDQAVRTRRMSRAQANLRWRAAVASSRRRPAPRRRATPPPPAKDPGLVATERVVNLIPVVGPIITTLAEALAPDPTFHINSEADLRTAIENMSLVAADKVPQIIALWNKAHPELMYDPLTRQRIGTVAPPTIPPPPPSYSGGGGGGGGGRGGRVNVF